MPDNCKKCGQELGTNPDCVECLEHIGICYECGAKLGRNAETCDTCYDYEGEVESEKKLDAYIERRV